MNEHSEGSGRSLEEELSSQQALLDAVMNASYDGICLISPDGRFLEMNDAFQDVTGLRREEWLGRTIDEMRATPGTARKSAALQVLKGSYPATTLVNLHGGELLLVTANPHFDGDGELLNVILNVRNFTQLSSLKRQLERHRGEDEVQELERSHLEGRLRNAGLDEIVVKSPAMIEIVSTAMQIADYDLTVLIEGETGVGKGVLAELIHRSSRRRDKPFVQVNCGAIPDSLVESELFGYESGAFTGSAPEGKEGFFEAAAGGTIFLDEIGELPKSSQAKILQILDDRVLTRVGSTEPRRLDVRVIAATNRRLRDLMRRGEFRADLLYRLETIPLFLPPLRERREDMIALIESLLASCNREYGGERTIAQEAVHFLLECELPGNVRELKNLIVRLALTGNASKEIGLEDVQREVARKGAAETPPGGARPPGGALQGGAANGTMKSRLEEVERHILTETSQQCSSTYEMAEQLGIDQSSVVRKMKKYGIGRSKSSRS